MGVCMFVCVTCVPLCVCVCVTRYVCVPWCVCCMGLAKRVRVCDVHVIINNTSLFDLSVERHKLANVHHHHLSPKRESRLGTTDDFATSVLHFSLLCTALWDLANSRPIYSLVFSSHSFLCLSRLLPPFTVPCADGFGRT